MEAKMTTALDYELSPPDFCDLAVLRLHQMARNSDGVQGLTELCHYLGKFALFDYELCAHYSSSTLSAALLNAAVRVFGGEKSKEVIGSVSVDKDTLVCTDLILDAVKSLGGSFKNLNNVYKFADQGMVQRVDTYLRIRP